jgi:cutinase
MTLLTTKGSIPNYPKDRVKVFCDETSPGRFGDGVCGGTLAVNAGHMVYMRNGDGKKAVAFLKSKIDPRLGAGSMTL